MEQSLYGDTRNRLAPVGVTGLRHGTSLKNVARTGIQTGDDHWCLDCGESFARPRAGNTSSTQWRPLHFVATRVRNRHESHLELATLLPGFDLADRSGNRRRFLFGRRLRRKTKRQERRHLAVAISLGVMRELFQETCDYFLLMVLFRDGCFRFCFVVVAMDTSFWVVGRLKLELWTPVNGLSGA